VKGKYFQLNREKVMTIENRITKLFNINFPIIQGGMVWVSGWRLASAVSENGGLGLIGAGSMSAGLLKEHIQKCKAATEKSFGVNIPLLREDAENLIQTAIDENVKIVFTSAGNPAKFIDKLKENGMTVVHVIPSVKHAKKAESVGCDAVVAEGIEAGGHNGYDETTTFTLVPQVVNAVNIPVIAAGGIADGRGILAALSLGAEGVQIGTRFAVTQESSAHQKYKEAVVNCDDKGTTLIFRKIGNARVVKNEFSEAAVEYEFSGATKTELLDFLGKKRERLGIFEGDTENGMIEAGQAAGLINDIPTVKELMENLIKELEENYSKLKNQFSID
jgi:enoyl-[acyl-carrier protein] reductase II